MLDPAKTLDESSPALDFEILLESSDPPSLKIDEAPGNRHRWALAGAPAGNLTRHSRRRDQAWHALEWWSDSTGRVMMPS